MKLRTRLFILVVLTLLPVIGIEVYNESDARSQRAQEGKEQALRLVRLVAQQQFKVVEGTGQLLTALGKMPVVRDNDAASCNALLADLIRFYPQYLNLISLDLAGRPLCLGMPDEAMDGLRNRAFFKLAIESRGFAMGDYDVSEISHRKGFYLSQPYYDANGTISGVVAAKLNLDWLNMELAHSALPPKATVSIIDRHGTILARYPEGEKFVGSKIPGQAHSYLLTGGEGVQEALGFDGVARIYSYTSLPGGPPGLSLSVGLDKDELLKESVAANRRDGLVIMGSCVLALILAGLGARVFISRPILGLLDAAEHWRRGDLDVRIPFPNPDSEFGRLGAAFNAMAAAMSAREQDLEQRVQERTEALQAAMQARQMAEAALFEAQKMEMVGRLTGGVAHDFNNLLAVIVGNVELARAHLGPDHRERMKLDAALQGANRGAALIQQLLAFARRQHLRPEVVDLNDHIGDLQVLLRQLLRCDIAVVTRLAPDAGLVRVDPNPLQAAILNLAINARDAMPNGGTLWLETRNARFPDGVNPIGLVGDFVAITVTDTGVGIEPDILTNVFEPFFTTKPLGTSSGLGLSMVQGFVRQSSGAVAIESEVGRGTSVTLYLPHATAVAKTVSSVIADPAAGQGTIFLVDDDDEVRSVTAQLLELSGYTVISARTADEAINYVRPAEARLDILITNLVLSDGLNGIALAAAMRDRRPGLPVLLMTDDSEMLLDAARIEGMRVLAKPFVHTALTQAVSQAIRLSKQSSRRETRIDALDAAK